MTDFMKSTVNDVIRRWPRTVEVFSRFGIDSCCGGGLPAEEAAARHGIDPEHLKAELDAVILEVA